jgi:hypothetical protein
MNPIAPALAALFAASALAQDPPATTQRHGIEWHRDLAAAHAAAALDQKPVLAYFTFET